MPDYTELPRHIADCMKRVGAELSEDQYMLLASYLAQTQSELTAAKAESERLRGRISEALRWIDGDLRETIRDVGNMPATYNDLYECADKIERILLGEELETGGGDA